jgi:hypothetical protein
MVILIFGGGIFLGLSLGVAIMACLDARRHRLQCEKAMGTSGNSPRRKVHQAFPAKLPASSASCQLSIVP